MDRDIRQSSQEEVARLLREYVASLTEQPEKGCDAP